MGDTLRTKLSFDNLDDLHKYFLWGTLANLQLFKQYKINYDNECIYGIGSNAIEYVCRGAELWSGDEADDS